MRLEQSMFVLAAWLILAGAAGVGAEAPKVLQGSPTAEAALVKPLGLMPQSKRGLIVPEDERNPYANRVVVKEKPVESGSEAAKIVKQLEKLHIRGIVRDGNGNVKTVLLGDLPLTEGRDLPQLLPSQMDKVFVSKMSNKEVEITWRTDAGKVTTDPRRWMLKVDERPKVEVILPGQPDVKDEAKLRALLVGKPESDD